MIPLTMFPVGEGSLNEIKNQDIYISAEQASRKIHEWAEGGRLKPQAKRAMRGSAVGSSRTYNINAQCESGGRRIL